MMLWNTKTSIVDLVMRALFASAALVMPLVCGFQAFAETPNAITVIIDRATLISAPEGTSTLVVGNPAIADTSIQRNNVIVLTGKSFGTTNIVAIDSSGKTIKEILVSVRSPDDQVVTVHRGVERESYSCMPKCERTIRLGDSQPFFDLAGAQTGARNGLAQQGQSGGTQSGSTPSK